MLEGILVLLGIGNAAVLTISVWGMRSGSSGDF